MVKKTTVTATPEDDKNLPEVSMRGMVQGAIQLHSKDLEVSKSNKGVLRLHIGQVVSGINRDYFVVLPPDVVAAIAAHHNA